jgi:hypothetical protein
MEALRSGQAAEPQPAPTPPSPPQEEQKPSAAPEPQPATTPPPKEEEQKPAAAPAAPERALKTPQDWLVEACKAHPRKRGESKSAYARYLQGLMVKESLTAQWVWETVRRRLYPD